MPAKNGEKITATMVNFYRENSTDRPKKREKDKKYVGPQGKSILSNNLFKIDIFNVSGQSQRAEGR